MRVATRDVATGPGLATAELVAKTIEGLSCVEDAQRALGPLGAVVVTGNRITVDACVEAVLALADETGWWEVYNLDGAPPAWIVGTCCASGAGRDG